MSVPKNSRISRYSLLVALLTLILVVLAFGPRLMGAASQLAQTADVGQVPGPLPEECGGVNPNGGPDPICCSFGYVYVDGLPLSGADVTIESANGTRNVSTEAGEASPYPYYGIDLSSDPLELSAGDIITVTATHGNKTKRLAYQVAPGAQQVDVVLDRSSDDWWDTAYAYRRVLTFTIDNTWAAGTIIKVDKLNFDSLVSAGKARPDHNDIRVARRISAHNWEQVPRVYYTEWDLEFQLTADLGSGTHTSYYLYYGNPNAASTRRHKCLIS
jgi:hypothetical protein